MINRPGLDMRWWRLLGPFFGCLSIFLQILRREIIQESGGRVLQISQKPRLARLLARCLCCKFHNLIAVQLEEGIPG
jgi:hypothetical protein